MFWRGVWGYLPVNVVQGLVGFGAIYAFTRLLSPEAFGWYALALAVGSLLHTVCFTWNEAAMARFHQAEAVKGGLAHHQATIYGLLATTWLVFPVAALATLVWPMPEGLKVAIAAGIGSVMARTVLQLAQIRRRAAGEVQGAAGLEMACSLGGLALGLLFAWAGMQGAAPLAGGGLAAALCAAWALPRDLAELKGGRFQPERARSYARYGVPLSLSLVLTLVLGAVDRMLLAAFLDESTVGVYHAGYSLSNRTLDVIFLWLGMAGAPAAYAAFERGGKAGLERAALDLGRLMVLITFPAAVGVSLVAVPLSDVMVGEAFRDGAARVIPWIALSGLLAGFTTHYLNQGFTVSHRTGRLVAAMAIAATANIGLNLALIPLYGLDGALWATAASFAIGAVASWALSRDAVQLPLPLTDMARCAAACGVMALAVSAVPAFGGVLELSLKAVVGAVVYSIAVFALDASGARSQAARLLQARRARTA